MVSIKTMFNANYHTHTKRCGHATGEDEEYVIEAIGYGYQELGFSDHAMLPDFSEPGTRAEFSEFQGYYDSIHSLKEKYQGKIEIHFGFEAEGFVPYFPFFHELVDNGILDYMILGNHSAMDENHQIVCRFSNITSASQLYLYRDVALQALATGLYRIFAHPDYFMSNIPEFDSDCRKVSKSLIEACIAYDIPLEVNVAGIRNGKREIGTIKRWRYPTDEFFSLAGKYGAKCILGMDAHAPEQLTDDSANYLAAQFAKEHNLVLVDSLPCFRKK